MGCKSFFHAVNYYLVQGSRILAELGTLLPDLDENVSVGDSRVKRILHKY